MSASYYYDGLGERVEKVLSNGQSVVYVYDAFGDVAEEYSPYNVWSKDNIWLGGQMLATDGANGNPCWTCFLGRDQVGTVRLMTDPSTNLITRHDYLPFGDEIPAGTAGRGSQFGPGADGLNQKFTGQYRDTETGLDFFNARYYAMAIGRFLSPDPGNAGADPTDPQTWNAYAYVRNNPLSLVDPSGMCDVTEGDTAGLSPNTPLGCGDDGGSSFSSDPLPSNPSSNVPLNPGCCTISFSPPTDIPDNPNPNPNPGFALFPAIFGNGWVGVGSSSTPTYSVTTTSHQNVSTVSTPPNSGPTFTKAFLPPNANICFDNQNYFYAPPTFDITKIEAAGRAGGSNPGAMNAAVGHYGAFDFQRTRDSGGNTTFYTGYTPVSNFSVGAYLYSAGFSKGLASFISNSFAFFRSSNAGDPAQATFRNLGYDTAARGQIPVCRAR